MHRYAGLAVILAACGGSADLPTDAPPGDGSRVDANLDGPSVDAPIDAAPLPPFSGTISVLEVDALAPGMAQTTGQGLRIRASFVNGMMLPLPVLEENTAGTSCAAWEYSAAEAAHATIGMDEGALFFQFSGGAGAAPQVPSCNYRAQVGYGCLDQATADSGGTVALSTGDTATFTDLGTTFTSANSLGRYLRITGSANPANDGLFPILAVNSSSTIQYVNAARVAEVLPGTANHINVAGVGAIPFAADPGFLADNVALTINHVAGGAGHFPAFTLVTQPPDQIGDDFMLDAGSMALITHIARDGQAMMFTCQGNCFPNNAQYSEIELVTTDAPVAGLPPLAMPPPVTKQVRIRCSGPSTNPLVIPASLAAKLQTAGATRVQATFTRANVLEWPDPLVRAHVGHAIVAVTTF